MNLADDFERCVKRTCDDDRYQIDCILGLWGVSAPTQEQAETEARHYFMQYWRDGEYDERLDKLFL